MIMIMFSMKMMTKRVHSSIYSIHEIAITSSMQLQAGSMTNLMKNCSSYL